MPPRILSWVLLAMLLAEGALLAKTLTDARGRQVETLPRPARIVSASLASDEILVELLTRTKGLERLKALSPMTRNARYSNIVGDAVGVKGVFGEELEGLLSLRPDLVVLASYNRPELTAMIERAKVRAFVLGAFSSLDDIIKNVKILGELIGEVDAARELSERMAGELAVMGAQGKVLHARSKRQERPTVLSFNADGLVMARNTMFDSLVAVAGGENLASRQGLEGWPRIGTEALARMNPDLVVAPDDGRSHAEQLKTMQGLAGWKEIPAIRAGRVVFVPERELLATSHHVLKAARRMQEALFAKAPEIEKKP